MAAHRERFAEAGILLPINPTAVIERCMDKARTVEFLDEHGFELRDLRAARWFGFSLSILVRATSAGISRWASQSISRVSSSLGSRRRSWSSTAARRAARLDPIEALRYE